MIEMPEELPCRDQCYIVTTFVGGENIMTNSRCTSKCCYTVGHGDDHMCLAHDKYYYGGGA